jgi:hypothetical protein
LTRECKKCWSTEKTKRGECKPCNSARIKVWREANRDRRAEYQKQWHAANPRERKPCPDCGGVPEFNCVRCAPCREARNKATGRAASKRHRSRHLEKIKARTAHYYETNAERLKTERNSTERKAYKAAYKVANLERIRQHAQKRVESGYHRERSKAAYRANRSKYIAAAYERIGKIKSRTLWADRRDIEAIYASAARVTECTQVKHVVDHIIPLKGRNVSGLHVPANLRVITQRANSRKYNKVA